MKCRFPGCRGGTGSNWARYCGEHPDIEMNRLMYVPSAWGEKEIPAVEVDAVEEGNRVVFHLDPDDGRPEAGRVEEIDDGVLTVEVTATRRGEFPDGLTTEEVPVDRVVAVE